ncbi:DivIVA domain-containing protein [Eubacteriales bacterium OttesenSCG-928-M02]|nr:DivIVA domain-containing protein [Eubacteriales bacterium OttesenSCG-928-M02]
MITPKDIHEKNFPESKKGYDKDAVDDFLDEIIVDFDKAVRESKELQARIEALNSQVESYRGMENSLMHTMVTAHKAADEITEKTKREAEDMIDKAQKEAASLINSAEARARAKAETYEKEMVELENRILSIKNVLNEFKVSVLDYAKELVEVVEGISIIDSAQEVLDGMDPVLAQEGDTPIEVEAPAAEAELPEDAPVTQEELESVSEFAPPQE